MNADLLKAVAGIAGFILFMIGIGALFGYGWALLVAGAWLMWSVIDPAPRSDPKSS